VGRASDLGCLAAERGLVFMPPSTSAGRGGRLYRLTLHPSLFGGFDVVREWVRPGDRARPRRLVESHQSRRSAEVRLRQLVRDRLRRGYVPYQPCQAALGAALRPPAKPRSAPAGLLAELAIEVASMPRSDIDWI
jgi:predicted DNA-binding WGR domain protein